MLTLGLEKETSKSQDSCTFLTLLQEDGSSHGLAYFEKV